MTYYKFLPLALFSFLFLLVACSDQDPIDMEMEEEEKEIVAPTECSEASYGFYTETPNVTFQQDSSWLTFYDGAGVVGDRLGYLGWDYPGWNGANDIIFSYPNSGLEVGQYEVTSVAGVVEFDGMTGVMLLCPCDDFTLEITEINKDEGFCCGVFAGKAKGKDDQEVDVEGTFKAFLDGE